MEDEDKNRRMEVPESTLRIVEQARKEAEGASRRLEESLAEINAKLPKIPEIPENVLQAVKTANEVSRAWQGKIEEAINPKTVLSVVNPDAIRERNAWDRHKEILDKQNAIVGVLVRLLDEQKSGSVLAKWILGFTIALALMTIILVIKSL